MKSHRAYLTFNIPSRMGFRNITPEVRRAVAGDARDEERVSRVPLDAAREGHLTVDDGDVGLRKVVVDLVHHRLEALHLSLVGISDDLLDQILQHDGLRRCSPRMRHGTTRVRE